MNILSLITLFPVVALAGIPCTESIIESLKTTFYELPGDVVKACDGITPGFTLLDMVTKKGIYPTQEQIELFMNDSACKILYFDYQEIIGRLENCDYYPDEPVHKQADFVSFKELVMYRQEMDKKLNPTRGITRTNGKNICSKDVLNDIKAKYYELPSTLTKTCDEATPGFTLLDMFSTKGNYPTDSQIEIYMKNDACRVVLYDFQAILNGTEPCEYYNGDLLQKQATFTTFKDLVEYHKSHDTTKQMSTMAPPQQTYPPCDVSQIDSITTTIQNLPVYSSCKEATGFDFDQTFRRTNVYPTLEQLQKFAKDQYCNTLYADVRRILSQAPSCLFYDKTHVSLAELSKFPTLDTLVSFQRQQEGHLYTVTPAVSTTMQPPQHEVATSSDKVTDSPSSISSILVIAGIFAAVGVIGAAIMYIRRKAASVTSDVDAKTTSNQSIFVVNANAAL